jgi:chitinase
VSDNDLLELILSILGIVFSVIPFVGTAARAAGFAIRTGRTVTRLAEVGSAALSIVEVVQDPLSAPFAILDLVDTGKAIRSLGQREAFSKAAAARNLLTPVDLKLFSSEFRRKDEVVQDVIGKCFW